jgi:hypothetical protein
MTLREDSTLTMDKQEKSQPFYQGRKDKMKKHIKQVSASLVSLKKLFRPVIIRDAVMVAGLVVAGTSTAGADPVQISGISPFGALEDCGDFPGIGNGVNFLDSEVEPWLAVNPINSQNVVAFWQQDRWSDGGARGNVAGVSFDGGSTWQSVPIPGITDCTDGPWERASDPWMSFSSDGTLHQMSLVFQTDPAAGFGANAMVVSKSTDGGLTWTDPITLIEDDMPRILNDKNSLTADPNNSNFVYAVWDRLEISGAGTVFPENVIPGRGRALGVGLYFKGPIYFARSTDGGDTWEPARKIYETGGLDQTIGNQIVVLPNEQGSTVINFFTELKNVENSDQQGPGFNFNLALIRSNDKGKRWYPSPSLPRNLEKFLFY